MRKTYHQDESCTKLACAVKFFSHNANSTPLQNPLSRAPPEWEGALAHSPLLHFFSLSFFFGFLFFGVVLCFFSGQQGPSAVLGPTGDPLLPRTPPQSILVADLKVYQFLNRLGGRGLYVQGISSAFCVKQRRFATHDIPMALAPSR